MLKSYCSTFINVKEKVEGNGNIHKSALFKNLITSFVLNIPYLAVYNSLTRPVYLNVCLEKFDLN